MTTYSATMLEAADKLHKYSDVMETLSETENISKRYVQTDGSETVSFQLGELPEDYDSLDSTAPLVGSVIRAGGDEYRLSKAAFEKAVSQVGLRMPFAKKSPSNLMEDNLNYHFNHGGVKSDILGLLYVDNTALEMVPDKNPVFSSYQVVDAVANAASRHFGMSPTDMYFDYKMEQTLDNSTLRLIVPDTMRTISSQRHGKQVEDVWSVGINITNSMTGNPSHPLEVNGYMFAWWCTNGSITMRAESGKYSRRQTGTDWTDVSEWLTQSSFSIFDGIGADLDRVEHLRHMDLTGEIAGTVQDMVRSFGVPISAVDSVVDSLMELDDMSAYGFLNAVTQAANDPDLDEARRARIMRAGGGVVHALADRCDTCHRMNV